MLFESPEELDSIVSKAGFANSGGATVVRKEGRGCAIIKCMKSPIPEKGTPGMLSVLFNDSYKVTSGATGEARLTIEEALSVSSETAESVSASLGSATVVEMADGVKEVVEEVKEIADAVVEAVIDVITDDTLPATA